MGWGDLWSLLLGAQLVCRMLGLSPGSTQLWRCSGSMASGWSPLPRGARLCWPWSGVPGRECKSWFTCLTPAFLLAHPSAHPDILFCVARSLPETFPCDFIFPSLPDPHFSFLNTGLNLNKQMRLFIAPFACFCSNTLYRCQELPEFTQLVCFYFVDICACK